jgi:3-deoxy-D-manno-octulosonic-acid transferase
VWIAGSTHPGEEEAVLSAFLEARAAQPRLQLIVVPRQPTRAAEVRALAVARSMACRMFSEPLSPAPADVVVVDVMGRLGALYHLATVAFVGGSLLPKGGQSPIEPAAAGKPVLFGPHMTSFPDVARELLARQAALSVASAAEMSGQVRRLLDDPALCQRMGNAGRSLVAEHSGATRRAADLILHRLATLP